MISGADLFLRVLTGVTHGDRRRARVRDRIDTFFKTPANTRSSLSPSLCLSASILQRPRLKENHNVLLVLQSTPRMVRSVPDTLLETSEALSHLLMI